MTELREKKISIEYPMVEVLKNKKPAVACEVQTDPTESQRSMQVLRESEDKYRTLVEKSLDAIAIVKGDKFVFVNKVFLEMFGYESDKEVIGSIITEYLAPQSRALVRNRGLVREKEEEVPARYEVQAQKKDGTIFDVEISVGVITFQGEIARQVIIRDITQRKKMEQALRESEEGFRLFQSSVFDVIYRYDPQNNRYDFISPSVELQTGYTVKEFSSDPTRIIQRITHPEDFAKVQAEVERQIAKVSARRPFRVEYRIKRKNGREIWVSDQKTLEFTPEGKLCRINGVVRDITERKRIEEELRIEKERAERYLNIAGVTLATVNADESITLINKKGCKILGYKEGELIGRNWFDTLVPQRIRSEVRDVFRKLMAGDIEPVEYYENPLLTKDGEERLISFHNTVIRDPNGQIVGALTSGEDITERKQTEEALQQSEKKYRQLIENMREGIWCIDKDAYTTFLNPRMAEILGYSVEEMQGRHLFSFMDKHGMELCKRYLERRKQGVREQHDFEFIRKDGTRVYTSLETSPIVDGEGNYLGAVACVADITERKRAEEALRDNEEKYRDLFENANDLIQSVDEKGNFVYVNKKWKQVMGYSDGEIKKLTLTDILRRDQISHCMKLFEKVVGGETLYNVEAVFLTKEGKEIFVSGSVSPRMKDGKFVATREIFRDVTERKRGEEALRANEEKYRTFFNTSPDGIAITTLDGKIVDANQAYQNMLGYTLEELKELNYQQFTPEKWHEIEAKELRAFMNAGYGTFEKEYIRKDGTIFPVSLTGWLIKDKHGNPAKIGAFFKDITERKRAEEALRESEKKYRALVEVAQEGIGIVDRHENITFVNRALADLLGYTKGELLGLNLSQISDEEQLAEFREETKKRQQGKSSRYDVKVYTKTGEPKYCSISATPLFDDQARFYGTLGMLIDITDRKRTEEQLNDYTRQIEEKNLELKAKNQELTATRAQLVQKEKLRALGQMASGVAHNFNNLLAIILGRAQLLQLKAKDTDIGKGLSIIEGAALDASFTIKRIQDFTCVRKDQEFKWVNIDEVIEDVLALTKTKWKDQAEADGVSIRLEVQKDRRKLPPVAGDELELREVFTNIIFNAVEAMPKGGKITVKTQTDRKSVSVSFTDSGTGIPDEVQQKIFDPFFTTKGVRNAGLGLSVAYGIIQRHQGNIQIESQPRKGTTVVVRLPLSKISRKEEPKEKESRKPPGQGESVNILVIEDQKDVRELLFDILTSANYRVKLASGGAEGLEMYKRKKFDIVFTDLGMPKMSGWEVARAIKEIDSYTTVFLITGWGVEMDEGKLKKCGIDRVVTKPVRVEALLTLVSETMESKRREKELVKGSLVHSVER